ncbi:MAG: sigma-70 family RNA polymerase sigma factor [Polyangiaceae bacterium]|nr:sigma-70 family RNA polymerase sigma factor [Polyangiaceae bacterium]
MERAVVVSTAEEMRRLYPSVLAKTFALTRNLPDAEDAVQEAVERALRCWPVDGRPDSPEAWLVTVAANRHRDRIRSSLREERRADALALLANASPWVRIAVGEAEVARGWKDDLLRLLVACCHPALEPGEGAALALSTIVGLSVEEIARAFVVAPRTMEQRLTRARKRLRERGDADGASPEDATDRMAAVLRVVHLLFNEGYWSGADGPPIRADLCRLAIGLARSIADAFPKSAEAAGLLALLLLHDARRGARMSDDGAPVPLPVQDRSRWDHAAIQDATRLLERTLERRDPGPYQIEAAISAVHCRAPTADSTDWHEIASLYALLESHRPTPSVRVNRAFAVGRAFGAARGLALLDEMPTDVGPFPYSHLVRGTLLDELGRLDEARISLGLALEQARNEHEATQIQARLRRIGASAPSKE